jgi:hypothetical protein
MESKPGIRTTEFWLALAGQIIGTLVILGIFTPEQATEMQAALAQMAGAVVTGGSALGYSIGRGIAKGPQKPE